MTERSSRAKSTLFTLILAAGALVLPAAQGAPLDPMAERSADGVWETVAENALVSPGSDRLIVPDRYRTFRADTDALRRVLDQAPLEENVARGSVLPATVLLVPMPDGGYARFSIQESPVMEPALAAAFPEIRTYEGQGLDDPAASARFDWTPAGFHGMILSASGTVFIDPYRRGDVVDYQSYYTRDFHKPGVPPHCLEAPDEPISEKPFGLSSDRSAPFSTLASVGPTLRTYRLALAADGEYTQFHGGTVAGALAAMTTTVNRVTGVYERDLAIRMTMIANETSIIYTNPATDPYTDSSPTTLLTQNQSNLDAVIGSANYDIGHVVGTGGGGVASLGVVCRAGLKARGETGNPAPVGDPFDIDFVAHEMGHQFGATHSFNGTSGNCGGGNRTAGTAYEPGSGSTIMAYAGICGADDLQPHSDDYFHTISFDQIVSYVTTGLGTCSVNTSTGNIAPTIDAGANFSIPISTPFTLTATGSDANGDPLTYCWEEFDLGTFSPPNTDDGSRPIFRSFNPVPSPARTFPKLSAVLGNVSTFPETLPTFSRTMTFRVTARDNRSGGGGSNYDFMTLTTSATAGPFVVTQPNTAETWTGNSTRTVTWNPAGTTGAPVSTANVKISLSTDGGNTFSTVLAASTPNDGTEPVLIPNTPSTTARIKVEGVGNVFFDLSDVNFTIGQDPSVPLITLGTITPVAVGGDGDAFIESGEAGKLTIQLQNGGSVAATSVRGTLTTSTPGVVVVTSQQLIFPDIPAHGAATGATQYAFEVAAGVPCGQAISFTLTVVYSPGAGSVPLPFTVVTGEPDVQTFSYTTPAVPIPDNSALGVDVPITVSGFAGTIPDLNFKFDGTSCSPAAGSTTGGLSHLSVGDLVVKLRSPIGTSVTLMDHPGGTTNDGNHFCQTLLDDEAVNSIQTIVNASAPFVGSFRPANPLSVFDTQNPNGTWNLNVSDQLATNTGTLRRFSLIFNGIKCNAPLPTPGAVPDGSAASVPLTVGKNGGNVALSWGASCNASGVDYAIYEGATGSWYSHVLRLCSTQGLTTKTLVPGAGNRYYLVVPLTADREGSYGTQNPLAEIPPAASACHVQLLGACP